MDELGPLYRTEGLYDYLIQLVHFRDFLKPCIERAFPSFLAMSQITAPNAGLGELSAHRAAVPARLGKASSAQQLGQRN